MMSKKLFISRNLHEKSPFWKLKDRVDIYDHSLLQFRSIPFAKIPESQWLFFYSQQGVVHFFRQLSDQQFTDRKLAAFGPKTADVLAEQVPTIHFIGNGSAKATASALQLVTNRQAILFIRARQSRRSVQRCLPKNTHPDLIVYDNRPKAKFDVPNCDFLIFTSPLNAKTYFDKYPEVEGQIIFAIGDTTAQTIQQLTKAKVWVPPNPSEESLVTLVTKHL
ncbi:MAG: hypothetical protein HKN87_15775 [Saprospiraceae bacterium]|nr:hypothetical protein [Saprospiraceae bacterium]